MVRSIALRVPAAVAVALAAGAVLIMSAPSATATQGQPVLAGQTNAETGPTVVNNTGVSQSCVTTPQTGLMACGQVGLVALGTFDGVIGSGSAYGVFGEGDASGIYGGSSSTGDGVEGTASVATASGVFGENTGGGKGVFGASTTGNGVEGGTSGSAASGVYGSNSGTGYGVDGQSADGTGVLATSSSGTALRTSGRVRFSTAGIATIASGQRKVTVVLAGVTAADFVLATVQGPGAFSVKNAWTGSGRFTIFIDKAPTAPATVTVAYFVISTS